MATEVFTIIVDPNGKQVFDSGDEWEEFFCGRYDEINTLAYMKNDDDLVEFTDAESFKRIRNELEAHQTKRDRELDRLQRLHEDAIEARRHATTLDEFIRFTEYADDVDLEMRETYWTRGEDMVKLMRRTFNKAAELAKTTVYHDSIPELNGYRVFWVISY